MNMQKKNDETKQLAEVKPTKFVKAYCSFWATAFASFKRSLPDTHKDGDTISIEAVEAFKRCFGNKPTVDTYPLNA